MIHIKTSTHSDAPDLIELHYSAFSQFTVFGPPWWTNVPALQRVLTSRKDFDEKLSRVAVDSQGRLVGHALWNPFVLRLDGQKYRALVLAPLGVGAAHQNQGIGTALMKDGLEMATREGYDLILIVGHPEFYTRFGFLTHCFGQMGIQVPWPKNNETHGEFRPLRPSDLGAIQSLWEKCRGTDRGILEPDPGLGPWCSGVHGVIAGVLEINGQVQGYARFDRRIGHEDAVRSFLVSESSYSASLLNHMKRLSPLLAGSGDKVSLPFNPDSPMVQKLFPEAKGYQEAIEPAMALAISGDPAIRGYLSEVLEQIKTTGKGLLTIEWGPVFDE